MNNTYDRDNLKHTTLLMRPLPENIRNEKYQNTWNQKRSHLNIAKCQYRSRENRIKMNYIGQ